MRLRGPWPRSLGVARLDAVLGFSHGGYQAFQWAVAGPVPAARVVVLASAPRGNGTAQAVTQLRQLAAALDAGVPAAREAWVACGARPCSATATPRGSPTVSRMT